MNKIGNRNNPLYAVWSSMKQRCYNPKNRDYGRYGERGITVCEEWLHSFSKFLEDMGDRPTKNHSLDRINNDLGYSKANCRWATPWEQGANKSKRGKTSRYLGVYKDKSKWSARVYIAGDNVYLGNYPTEVLAAKAYDSYIKKHKLPNKTNF